MIVLTLKLFLGSVLAPGMPKSAFYELFFIFCAGKKFDHGNPIIGNKYKNDEINKIRMVIISIYSTYLSKWRTTIPNYLLDPSESRIYGKEIIRYIYQ